MRLDPKLYEAPYFHGRARFAEGRAEDLLKLFERAADRGFGQREWIETDPDLTPLRGTPRYEAILKAM